MGGCCGDGFQSCERVFDERTARNELRRYRRAGPPWSTRALVEELAAGLPLEGASVLDIGAGVGAVHLALLERGAARAVDVDGSSAYLAAARDEAGRQGVGDRVTHVLGDASALASTLEPADLVALDRVICCFGDVRGLLGAATRLASRRIGLVYPHDRWWFRLAVAVGNPVLFGRSGGYRAYVHRRATVDGLLEGAGFARIAARDGFVWRVETWERVNAPA